MWIKLNITKAKKKKKKKKSIEVKKNQPTKTSKSYVEVKNFLVLREKSHDKSD